MGINWIADLRDPWTDIYYYQQFYHTAIARWYDRKLEKKVIENADRLISVSKDVMRLFNQKTKINIEDKTDILPNGFDSEDFNIKEIKQDNKYTITYTGTISEAYDISGFIAALKTINQEQLQKTSLRFVGQVPTVIVNQIKTAVPNIEIDLPGYVDHQKSIQFLLQSSMLLLVIPKVENNKGILTGKFFEYLAARKPILAIGPTDGDLAEIIKETGCGEIFDYADYKNIQKFIENGLNDTIKTGHHNIEKYSRKGLTEKLSQVIHP